MVDVVNRKTRSRMMSGIRGKDTKPEMIVRSGLHRDGYRFRLHDRNLPGCPDLVFSCCNAVIFVHGCFWHGHRCHLFKWPSTRSEWLRSKIKGNRKRDRQVLRELRGEGWRVLNIWECALKGPEKLPAGQVIQLASQWLAGKKEFLEISGKTPRR